MENIKKIYQELILKGKYNNEYANNAIEKDGYLEGVCIDFSKYLLEKFQKEGYNAHIISTNNEDGSLHAAVVYKDKKSGKIYIADPVTDIRMYTEQGLDINQRKELAEQTKNYLRDVEDYIAEFGDISIYDFDMAVIKENIKSTKELADVIERERYDKDGDDREEEFMEEDEINANEYYGEFCRSGYDDYIEYLHDKYVDEDDKSSASHIYSIYIKAKEEREKEQKKQEEKSETEFENAESADLSDKTVEELEAIIDENEETIVRNDKEKKDRLIQKILEQQQIIAKQQEEIDRLKSQKVK